MDDPDFERKKWLLKLILKQLNQYKNGLAELGELASGVESLIDSLEDIVPAWKSELLDVWWIFEEIYSNALANKQESIGAESTRLVETSIEDMRTLIDKYLALLDRGSATGQLS